MTQELKISLRDVGVRFDVSARQDKLEIQRWPMPYARRNKQNKRASRGAHLKGVAVEIEHGERRLDRPQWGRQEYDLSNGRHLSADIRVKRELAGARLGDDFELATGFEMTQTGWDNIRIRGMLLGLTPTEVEERIEQIGEFSELGEFLDYPVKTYSASMFTMRRFPYRRSAKILLLDEVMS